MVLPGEWSRTFVAMRDIASCFRHMLTFSSDQTIRRFCFNFNHAEYCFGGVGDLHGFEKARRVAG